MVSPDGLLSGVHAKWIFGVDIFHKQQVSIEISDLVDKTEPVVH
jgi:hypothetical protein